MEQTGANRRRQTQISHISFEQRTLSQLLSSFIIALNSLSFFRKSGLLSKVSHIHTRPSRHHLRCAGKTLSLLRNSDLSTLENVILTHVTFFCFFCFLFYYSHWTPLLLDRLAIYAVPRYITTLVTDFN